MSSKKNNNLISKENLDKSTNLNNNYYEEALEILHNLENGTIKLSSDEEKELRRDLDIILSSNSNDSFDISYDYKIVDDVDYGVLENEETNIYDVDEDIPQSDISGIVTGGGVESRDDVDFSSVDDASSDLDGNVDYGVFLENEETNSYDVDEDIPQSDISGIVTGGGVESRDDVDFSSVDDALSNLVDDYSNDAVIKVDNVSMDFKLSKDKIDTFKEFFIRTIKRNKGKSKTITALKNISFEIPKGDRVGIIGFNGAGKSTLLKLLARVYYPTGGTIETKGKIAPLLELGAGFDLNYTGKANIYLNGAFLGYSEEFLKEKYDEIVEFSELGDAINYHVKTYSSGMRAKLGFSIATIVEPDILIIDEILSVGDIKFQRKSSDKIRSLINSGITVLLVSHSLVQIRELCNKAIWLDEGEIKMMGEVNKVCDAYVEAANNATKEQLKNIDLD